MRETTLFWRCRCYPPNGKLFFFFVKSFTHASHFLVPVFFGQPDSPTMLLYIHRLRCLGASNCVNRFWSTVFLQGLKTLLLWWPFQEKVEEQFQLHMFGDESALFQVHPWRRAKYALCHKCTSIEYQFHETNCHFNTCWNIFQNWQGSYKTWLVPIPQTTIRACTHDKTHQI